MEFIPVNEQFQETATETAYGYLVKNGTCIDEQIVVPQTYEEKPVVGLAAYAFHKNDTATSVVLPEGIAYIGDSAFYESKIAEVNLPDTVTTIDNQAFARSALIEVTVPNSVTSFGTAVFTESSALKKVVLPESLTTINNATFSQCTSLQSVMLPNCLISIQDYAFWDCTALTELTLPDSVTTIAPYCFYSCSALKSINLPNSIEEFPKSAFLNCNSLYQNEGGVLYINQWVYGCEPSAVNITLRKGTTGICHEAFSCFDRTTHTISDNNLTSIVISDGVTFIGDDAFLYCKKLESVKLPKSGLKYLGKTVFESCEALKEFDFPTGFSVIGESMFDGCRSLKQVTIPEGVTAIGRSAFRHCPLITLDLPNSLKTIERGAFYGMSAKTVVIPDAVTTIGLEAFVSDRLTAVYLPKSVIEIGSKAFQGSTGQLIVYCETEAKPDGWSDTWDSRVTEVRFGQSKTDFPQ